MKIRKMFAILILLTAIGVMGYAGTRLYKADQVYRKGNAVYEDLTDRIREKAEHPQETAAALPEKQKPKTYIPAFNTDFKALKKVNEDSAAWLYSPGTMINYPVMKANDYNYYLKHLPDGTWNANGSLFIDYNNAPDFSEPLTVIYGHHMKSEAMFGSLKGYKAQSYYKKHPFMYLYTQKRNYRIDLMYGAVIAAGQWSRQGFMYSGNVESLVAYAAENTTFKSDVSYKIGDRLVALSTCSYEYNEARYVVIGVLRNEY
ncbi:MAG: class B sortase [Oscillospiraceae bacterium]|nr:class B sortase [Oscillospiraceae bacterium]